jgi:hypothetical protein
MKIIDEDNRPRLVVPINLNNRLKPMLETKNESQDMLRSKDEIHTESIESSTLGSFTNNFNRVDMLILKIVYESPTILPTLHQILRKLYYVNLTREAIRKRIVMLSKFNLVDKLSGTCPACINPKIGKERFIENLVSEFIAPFKKSDEK